MISLIYWDPAPIFFSVPFLNFPVFWYGVFFALGFWLGMNLFIWILTRYFEQSAFYQLQHPLEWKKRIRIITDRLTMYVVVGTIVGARLGHFLFYENPADYFTHPLILLQIRDGGLASHGAVVGIILSLFLFTYRMRSLFPELQNEFTWIRWLDFLSPPAAMASCCIRIGNFFNQEILGIPTTLPWAVVFGHPLNGAPVVPRHPVQLYEALWYLFVFLLLWRLSRNPCFLSYKGRLAGLLLMLIFSFRFFIEFFKEEQSLLLDRSSSHLTMGQILSLPIILLGGLYFFLRRRQSTPVQPQRHP